MSHDRVQNTVEFHYNDEKIIGTLFTYFHGGIEKSQTFMFNYKGNSFNISLNDEENYYFIAPLHCEIMDKLGLDGYRKYDKYLSDIHSIELNHIIVYDNVYNYFSQCISTSPRYYFLNLKMEDGTSIDGTYNFMTTQDKGNKRLLFKNLQSQADNYFKIHKIVPAKEQLNEEKTKEYQEKINWIRKINESL